MAAAIPKGFVATRSAWALGSLPLLIPLTPWRPLVRTVPASGRRLQLKSSYGNVIRFTTRSSSMPSFVSSRVGSFSGPTEKIE